MTIKWGFEENSKMYEWGFKAYYASHEWGFEVTPGVGHKKS